MAKPAKKTGPDEIKVNAVWDERLGDLDPVFADQLHVHRINDQFYLTLGRLEVPPAPPGENTPIKSVARFVVPKDAMVRIRDLFNRILKEDEK